MSTGNDQFGNFSGGQAPPKSNVGKILLIVFGFCWYSDCFAAADFSSVACGLRTPSLAKWQKSIAPILTL